MKLKNLLVVLLGVFMVTGCGDKNIELDLQKIEIELNNLEIDEDGEKVKLFENNTKMDVDAIEGRQIDVSLFEEILFSMNTTSNEANVYIVYLPKEGKEEECETQIDNYLDTFKENVALYNPKEAKKIEDRLEENYGKYHIYIISKDNELALNKIKNIK